VAIIGQVAFGTREAKFAKKWQLWRHLHKTQSVINVNPALSYPERGEPVALGSEVPLISGYPGVSDE
jgi:hypothetical protein